MQAVRYSPNGSHFASGGFDGKVFIYDGATADLVGEVGGPAHKGGVYGVSCIKSCKNPHMWYLCVSELKKKIFCIKVLRKFHENISIEYFRVSLISDIFSSI